MEIDLKTAYESGDEFTHRNITFYPVVTGVTGAPAVLQGELGVDLDRRWGWCIELAADGRFRVYRYPDLMEVSITVVPWSIDNLTKVIESLKR